MPDIRTLRANTSETVVYPYMFGAESNCSAPSPVAAAEQFPEVGAAGSANHEQAWMPNGWERTMSWTAWISAPSRGVKSPTSLESSSSAENIGDANRVGL